eukprot:TRINITY_DN5213_c0_g1_i3.p1 TRINITY_DN5213_c0_g1~~TRINITY_DN5213_c0_g1_i3.p1  ORF type:complete len:660 (+),score=128.24 TRINITY_DN5213_c0_g1_i3:397-2376(+)
MYNMLSICTAGTTVNLTEQVFLGGKMPFVANIEFLVSFLKLRNIDLLQQGLYRVAVSMKMEQGSKEAAVPVATYCNDPSGRRGQWQDTYQPTYPEKKIDPENKSFHTRTFFVRFQEQVEVLDEVVHFRVECDAMQVLRTWGDNVVLTFDLWHVSKEDLEKIPTECYERKLADGTWEAYSDTAQSTILKYVGKGKKLVAFKHHGVNHSIQIDENDIREVPSKECPEGREVRIATKIVPDSAFSKVATRSIPLRNSIMPHTEWVPVMWHEWFAACCQVLVHSSIVSFQYKPAEPDPTYAPGNRAFRMALKQGSLLEVGSDEKCFTVAADTFHVMASYLVYAYYYIVDWLRLLTNFEYPRSSLEKLRDRLSRMNERFTAKSELGNMRALHTDPNSSAVSLSRDEDEDDTNDETDDNMDIRGSTPELQKGMILPSVVPSDEAPDGVPSTVNIKPNLVSLLQRYKALSAIKDPPLAADLCHPCSIDIFSETKAVPTDVLSCFSNGVSHELDEIIDITKSATAHLTSQFTSSVPATAEQIGMEEACAVTCATMLTTLSAEVQDVWHHLVSRAIPQGAPTMMTGAKRSYWRTETLRSRRCISSQPPAVKDVPRVATIKAPPTSVHSPLQLKTSRGLQQSRPLPHQCPRTFHSLSPIPSIHSWSSSS